MSDTALEAARPRSSLVDVRAYWRPALAFAVAGAAATGLLVPAGSADAELAVLLRFMAVVKAVMALGAAALLGWRLAWPIRNGVAFGCIIAVSAMACGSALIWQLGHVGAGAALVHGGLAALAGLAWLDRAGWEQAASTLAASSRRGWPGLPPRRKPRSPDGPSLH